MVRGGGTRGWVVGGGGGPRGWGEWQEEGTYSVLWSIIIVIGYRSILIQVLFVFK